MANLILTAKDNFKPFSFDDYMKPFLTYKNEYDKMEAFAGDLSALTESIRDRAELEFDEDWAKLYFQYANSLLNAANDLYTNGLNVNLRRLLNQLKLMYTNKVLPAQNAIKRQAEITKAIDAVNPQLRMMYAEMPSIAALIKDPSLTRTGYSGAMVELSAMDMAKSAATRNVLNKFAPYQTYWMQQLQLMGYSKEAVAAFRRDMASIPELNQIFEDVEKQFNKFQGLSNILKDKMTAEIMSGILKGVGFNQSINYQQNAAALEELKYQNNIRAYKELKRLEAELLNNDQRRLFFEGLNAPEYEFSYTAENPDIRRQLADATFNYLLSVANDTKNPDHTKVRRYFDKFRIKEGENRGKVDSNKAISAIYGTSLKGTNLLYEDIDSNGKNKLTLLGTKLRLYLRDNITMNEKIIDYWTKRYYHKGYNVDSDNQRHYHYIEDRTISDKEFKLAAQQLKMSGFEYKANADTKRLLLDSAIKADASGDMSGVYKIKSVTNDAITPSRERISNDKLPKNNNEEINYNDITAVKVRGGMYLKWPGGEGFIPDKSFGRQITVGAEDREHYRTKELPEYLNDYKLRISKTVNPNLLDAAVEQERQRILKILSTLDYLSIPQLSRPISLKPQEIE